MLVRLPFSDLSRSKLRPSVVLADAGRGDYVLCQVTSSLHTPIRPNVSAGRARRFISELLFTPDTGSAEAHPIRASRRDRGSTRRVDQAYRLTI